MAYDLSYIRNRILEDKLDDPDFEPGIVDNFVNDAQRGIFNDYELPFVEAVFAGNITQGQHMFIFPDDYQQVQSFVITAPEGQQINISDNYMKFRDFTKAYPTVLNNPEGKPLCWTLHGDKLYFDKPLDQNYELTMFYLKKAPTLAEDDDVPGIPEEFQEVLILGAYYRILQRNEDYELASAVKVEYRSELSKMLNRLGQRQTTKTIVMGQPRVRGR